MQSRSDGLKGLNRRLAEVEAHASVSVKQITWLAAMCVNCVVLRERYSGSWMRQRARTCQVEALQT
jgi:hypothetical protein